MNKPFDVNKLKNSQEKFLEFARGKKTFMLNGPPGIGKTLTTVILAADEIRKNNKTLIVAPQLDILSNYKYPHGGIRWSARDVQAWEPMEPEGVEWSREEKSRKKPTKSEQLLSFLENGRGKVMLASHQLLGRISEFIRPEHMEGLLLVIDEAHHCMEDVDSSRYNKLGRVVQMAIDHIAEGGKTRVAMITASPFRSDRYPLLKEETMETCFSASSGNLYEIPMSECLKENNIRSINFHLVTFPASKKLGGKLTLPTNYPSVVEHIYRDIIPDLKKRGKLQSDVGIINMPHTSSGYNNVKGDRRAVQCQKLYDALAKHRKKIWNFASKESQQETIHEFKKFASSKETADVDTILTMGVLQEGSDYSPIDHTVIIGYTTAFTRTYQRIGRITRKYGDKRDTHVFIVMPTGVDLNDDQEAFNRFLKSICLAFVCHSIFNTVATETQNQDHGNGAPYQTSKVLDPRVATEAIVDTMKEIAKHRDDFQRDQNGVITTSGIRRMVELGEETIRDIAQKQGLDEQTQSALARLMSLRMPQLLDVGRMWSADRIEYQLVSDSAPGHHVSIPITYKLLKDFEAHVDAASSGPKLAYQDLMRWIDRKRRKPIPSSKDKEERKMHAYYHRFNDPKDEWGKESAKFKETVMSKIRLRTIQETKMSA